MVYVSAATIWELTIKSMLGKLEVEPEFESLLVSQGITLLPITAQHAAGIAQFPELLRHDPLDRLLIAQAKLERLDLLTADRVLLAGVTASSSTPLPDGRHSRLEPVPNPGLGDQVPRPGRVGLQLPPQLREIDPQVMGFVLVLRPPDLGEQLLLRHQPAGVPHQQFQQRPFGGGEPNRLIPAQHPVRGQIHGEIVGGHHVDGI